MANQLVTWSFRLLLYFSCVQQRDSATAPENNEDCELYMAHSLLPGAGRGIFAGKFIAKDSLIAIDESIVMKREVSINNQLNNYVYGNHNEAYVNLNIGIASILNHMDSTNTRGELLQNPMLHLSNSGAAHTLYSPVKILASADIHPGEEIYGSYGDSLWFSDRNVSYSPGSALGAVQKSTSSLSSSGHCMSHVFVQKSKIPNSGKGLFAKKKFKTGDIVSISPVLILSKKVLKDSKSDSVLINYAVSADNTDAAILPLGPGAMINNGGDALSNTLIKWFDWSIGSAVEADGLVKLNQENSLINASMSSFAALDIAYIATRDISIGDEITMFYGASWETAWGRYANRRNDALVRRDTPEQVAKIKFRRAIGAPSGIFPMSWTGKRKCFPFVSCLDSSQGYGRSSRGKEESLNDDKSTLMQSSLEL